MSDALSTVSYTINREKYSFSLLKKIDLSTYSRINIFASGPSIEQQAFSTELLQQAAIFVNGSISLLTKYGFENVVGYVISDARFIAHSLAVIKQNYRGQPWFVTLPVLQALIKTAPDLVIQYHHAIHLIFAVDRPITVYRSTLGKLFGQPKQFKNQKLNLSSCKFNTVVFDKWHQPLIGVSKDITQGFVEAGTVAYVAAQLAFSMQAKEINLFGIDLINSNQPRFYENDRNKAPIKLDKAIENRIVPSFNLLAEEYEKSGCQVVNRSFVSKDLFIMNFVNSEE